MIGRLLHVDDGVEVMYCDPDVDSQSWNVTVPEGRTLPVSW